MTRLGHIMLDLDQKLMAFSYRGHYCELRGLGSTAIEPVDSTGMMAYLHKVAHSFLVQIFAINVPVIG